MRCGALTFMKVNSILLVRKSEEFSTNSISSCRCQAASSQPKANSVFVAQHVLDLPLHAARHVRSQRHKDEGTRIASNFLCENLGTRPRIQFLVMHRNWHGQEGCLPPSRDRCVAA